MFANSTGRLGKGALDKGTRKLEKTETGTDHGKQDEDKYESEISTDKFARGQQHGKRELEKKEGLNKGKGKSKSESKRELEKKTGLNKGKGNGKSEKLGRGKLSRDKR